MLPLSGSIEAVVLGVASASIHGDLYFDLVLQTDEMAREDRAVQVRAPQHVMEGGQPPGLGTRLRVSFLMQQVTGVEVVG
jgi:hypothetical protein